MGFSKGVHGEKAFFFGLNIMFLYFFENFLKLHTYVQCLYFCLLLCCKTHMHKLIIQQYLCKILPIELYSVSRKIVLSVLDIYWHDERYHTQIFSWLTWKLVTCRLHICKPVEELRFSFYWKMTKYHTYYTLNLYIKSNIHWTPNSPWSLATGSTCFTFGYSGRNHNSPLLKLLLGS